MTKRNVVVLTTGGTIASLPDRTGRSASGAMNGESLLEQVGFPEDGEVDVQVRSILQKPSNAITLADLLTIHHLCEELASQPDVHGIVITHGTDTLEDTAYFLDITLSLGTCALVITGSQRAPHEVGTDAYRNIANAVTVAAHPAMQGAGAVVVFNESIFAARHVRKISTYQVNGFNSPGYGKLGYVDGSRVHLAQAVYRPAPLPLGEVLPQVDIVPAYLDARSTMVDAAVSAGARGLVIEGLGRGHVPPGWLEPISRAIQSEIPVLVVSSCQQGPVHASYEFPGSLASLEERGAIAAIDLSARKARLALAVILSTKAEEDISTRIKQLMNLHRGSS